MQERLLALPGDLPLGQSRRGGCVRGLQQVARGQRQRREVGQAGRRRVRQGRWWGPVSTLANSALTATLRANGVNAARQDLSIDPPTAYGHPPTTGYAVDPVNTSTGNFVETESDLGFAGACDALELTRTYNSVNDRVGAFGAGWSSWTETGLRFDEESAVFVRPDGREITFPRMGSGWDRAIGENLWLAADGATHVVSGNDGTRWTFSREGRVTEKSTGAVPAYAWSGSRAG